MNTIYREVIDKDPTLNFCAPFTMAANIRGIEQLLMDIMMDSAFEAVHKYGVYMK